MRLMWLWVLLYAIVIGLALFCWGIANFWGLSEGTYHPQGIALDIGQSASFGSIFTTIAGFAVLFAGFILLLIPSKFSAGRVVSVIGICFYYIAALAVVLAASIDWASRDFRLNSPFLPALLTAAVVFFLGFLIMRKLRRLQAEYFEY
jgi:hypothetical protein